MAHKFVDCISYYREKIFSHCYFLYKLKISEYCVYVADQYQHTIQCMNTKNTYLILEKSAHIYFGLDENWVFCLGEETKNIYKWWIVVPWTTLFYHHIPNKAMIWQIVFHIKKGMQRNGAWLRYAMRSFIQTKNGCHCPCNCLGWHTTITASTTMRQMGISLNECMIFCHFIMKFLK